MMTMTRKDHMREGYVARNFHITENIDTLLKIRAAKDRVRFSDVVEAALKQYLRG